MKGRSNDAVARDYVLRMDASSKTNQRSRWSVDDGGSPYRKISVQQQAEEQASRLEGDFVPMHRTLHGRSEIIFQREKFSCIVVKIGEGWSVHRDVATGLLFREDDKTGSVTKETTETKTANTHTAMHKISSYTDVLDAKIKNTIKIVEGKLVYLSEPSRGKVRSGQNAGNDYALQNGSLKFANGKEVKVFFSCEDVIQPMSRKGKNIRISCSHSDKHGYVGVYRDETNEYTDKKNKLHESEPQIRLTSTAIVEVLNAAGEPVDDGGSKGGDDDAQVARPERAGKQRSQQSQGASGVDFRKAIFAHLVIVGAVNKAYRAMVADEKFGLPAMTAEDLRQIATSVMISGQRGDSVDESAIKHLLSQSTEDKPSNDDDDDADVDKLKGKPEKPWDDDDEHGEEPDEPSEPSWRDFTHPKRGKTLGELWDDEKTKGSLMTFYRFFLCHPPEIDDVEADRFARATESWALENEVSPLTALIDLLRGADEFKEGKFSNIDISDVVGDGGTLEGIVEMLNAKDEVVDRLCANNAKKKKAKKKTTEVPD